MQPIAAAVKNLSSVVVGESAWNIEAIWNRMYRFLYYNGMGGVVMAAISGIDGAIRHCREETGRTGLKLLGGQVHEKLRVYANGWIEGIPVHPKRWRRRRKSWWPRLHRL